MKYNNNIFKKRLRKARKFRKLKQKELAEISKIDASQISHFEIGSRTPYVSNLFRLALALNVSTDYLLGLTNNRFID